MLPGDVLLVLLHIAYIFFLFFLFEIDLVEFCLLQASIHTIPYYLMRDFQLPYLTSHSVLLMPYDSLF